jgi:hypothetical protein
MYSGVFERFNLVQTVQYWMCEMHRIERFSNHFVCMTLVCKIMAENWGIFPSHLDGSQKHIELGRIRGFDIRFAI